MKCPRCQHDNPSGSSFCLECGARLPAACASCATELPAGAKFCNKCGTPVGSEVSNFASPEGERKQVTVLFADLRGSMELLADRDPDEARRIPR